MKFHYQCRLTKTNSEGDHVLNLGVRIGYWPCLYAPFVQIAVGKYLVDLWYGYESYEKDRT